MYTSIKKINLEASSVEDAIRRVALELDVPESHLQAKIISEGKGFLGIFGKKLQLEITVNPEHAKTEEAGKKSVPEDKQEISVERTGKKGTRDVKQVKPAESTKKKRKPDVRQEIPVIPDDISESSKDDNENNNEEARLELINDSVIFINELIAKMDLNVSARATENFFISIEGEDAAIIVGKYGDTLKAIEYISNLCIRETKEIPRIRLDSDGYRDRRASNLQRLAISMAKKAAMRGIPIKLEPMASWERRIIHLTLQDSSDVFTESIGEPPDRKVVIMPKVNHNEVRTRPRRRSRR